MTPILQKRKLSQSHRLEVATLGLKPSLSDTVAWPEHYSASKKNSYINIFRTSENRR